MKAKNYFLPVKMCNAVSFKIIIETKVSYLFIGLFAFASRQKLKIAPLIIQHDNHMSGIKGLSFQGIHIIQFILLEG